MITVAAQLAYRGRHVGERQLGWDLMTDEARAPWQGLVAYVLGQAEDGRPTPTPDQCARAWRVAGGEIPRHFGQTRVAVLASLRLVVAGELTRSEILAELQSRFRGIS